METKTTKQIVDDLDKVLDEYEQSLGLKDIPCNQDALAYLKLTREQLQKMQPAEISEARYMLAQYALFLQKNLNKETTRINWADANIRSALTQELKQYNAPSFEERKLLAIAGNDYAQKLNKIRIHAQARADRISFLANNIRFVCDTLEDIRRSKYATSSQNVSDANSRNS